MASHNVVLLPGPLSALHAYLRAFVSSVVLLTVMGRQAKPFLPSSLCLSCLALLVRPPVRPSVRSTGSPSLSCYIIISLSRLFRSFRQLRSPYFRASLWTFLSDSLDIHSCYCAAASLLPPHCIPTPVSYFLIPSSFGLPNVLTSHSVSDHPCTLFFMYSSVYWKVKSYILGSSLV